jgi:hypothetical protein
VRGGATGASLSGGGRCDLSGEHSLLVVLSNTSKHLLLRSNLIEVDPGDGDRRLWEHAGGWEDLHTGEPRAGPSPVLQAAPPSIDLNGLCMVLLRSLPGWNQALSISNIVDGRALAHALTLETWH